MGCSEGPGLKQFLEASSVHFFVEERAGRGLVQLSVKMQDTWVCMALCSTFHAYTHTHCPMGVRPNCNWFPFLQLLDNAPKQIQ